MTAAHHLDPVYGSRIKYFMGDFFFFCDQSISQLTVFVDRGSVCRILEGNIEGYWPR